MNLGSKKYPELSYEKGKDLDYLIGVNNLPFFVHADKELLEDPQAILLIARGIDNADILEKVGKTFLVHALSQPFEPYTKRIQSYMNLHREKLAEDVFMHFFNEKKPHEISDIEMVNFLTTVSLTSSLHLQTKKQIITLDMMIDPMGLKESLLFDFDLIENDLVDLRTDTH